MLKLDKGASEEYKFDTSISSTDAEKLLGEPSEGEMDVEKTKDESKKEQPEKPDPKTNKPDPKTDNPENKQTKH